jgi:hypothetical protein
VQHQRPMHVQTSSSLPCGPSRSRPALTDTLPEHVCGSFNLHLSLCVLDPTPPPLPSTSLA